MAHEPRNISAAACASGVVLGGRQLLVTAQHGACFAGAADPALGICLARPVPRFFQCCPRTTPAQEFEVLHGRKPTLPETAEASPEVYQKFGACGRACAAGFKYAGHVQAAALRLPSLLNCILTVLCIGSNPPPLRRRSPLHGPARCAPRLTWVRQSAICRVLPAFTPFRDPPAPATYNSILSGNAPSKHMSG